MAASEMLLMEVLAASGFTSLNRFPRSPNEQGSHSSLRTRATAVRIANSRLCAFMVCPNYATGRLFVPDSPPSYHGRDSSLAWLSFSCGFLFFCPVWRRTAHPPRRLLILVDFPFR